MFLIALHAKIMVRIVILFDENSTNGFSKILDCLIRKFNKLTIVISRNHGKKF